MSVSAVCILISVAVYLLGMMLTGFACSHNKTSEDFYLGGRRLGPVVAAMSTEASDMSAYLLMGVPGLALFCGVAEAGWTALGLALGTWLNWLLVAKRLRRYSERLNAITVPDFLAKRFRDDSHIIETLGAVTVVVFFVPYTASGFSACSKLFSSLFGFDYMKSMLLSAAVIVIYCTAGGFMAASVTSLIQGIVMSIALVVILFFGAHSAGGWSAVLENARAVPGYLDFTASTDILSASPGSYTPLMRISTLAWGLGYFGMPHVLVHFMAVKDDSKLRLSRRIGSLWCLVSLAVAVLIGIVGLSMARAGLVELPSSVSQAESLIVNAASYMSSFGILPALAAGLIIAGILSATMSTADAQLLAAASGVTHNLLEGVFGVKLSDKKTMLVARLTVVAVAVLGVIFARDPSSSIFRVVSFAWAGFGATFGPVMLMGLFWKRCTAWGAIAGMLSGAACVFLWKFLVAPLGGIFAIYELLPAFMVSCLFIVTVSLLGRKPDSSVYAEFEAI